MRPVVRPCPPPHRVAAGACAAVTLVVAATVGPVAPAASGQVGPVAPRQSPVALRGPVVEPPHPGPGRGWALQQSTGPVGSPHRWIAPGHAFTLASRPSAPITVYLDFTGTDVTDTVWAPLIDTTAGRVPPWDLDGDRSTYSIEERRTIIAVWEAVAEDFAPFEINVTTAAPPGEDLLRESGEDQRHGSTIVVTDEVGIFTRACGRCSGLAFGGAMDRVGDDDGARTGFAIIGRGWGHPLLQRYLGDAVAHELGHHFGLDHRGQYADAYHRGRASWAPLMGGATGLLLTQWSDGRYVGGPEAARRTPDLATIARTAPYVPDDHGDGPSTATVLRTGSRVNGLVGHPHDCAARCRDLDVFTLDADRPVRIRLTATGFPPNLVPELTVRSASGAIEHRIARPRPRTFGGPSVGARLDLSLVLDPAGTAGPWTLTVTGGTALGAPTAYGSLGSYRLDAVGVRPRAALRLSPRARPLWGPRARPWHHASLVRRHGGYPPYRWTAHGLPSGLRLDPRTGRLTGQRRPALRHGAPLVDVTVVDAAGARANLRLRLPVRDGAGTHAPD